MRTSAGTFMSSHSTTTGGNERGPASLTTRRLPRLNRALSMERLFDSPLGIVLGLGTHLMVSPASMASGSMLESIGGVSSLVPPPMMPLHPAKQQRTAAKTANLPTLPT